jgi:aryl-alcohol dehydrogenase-like predicted oxidoreductase
MTSPGHPTPVPLIVGTAQFGSPYGVANRTGRPSYEEVRAIVLAAHEGGVTLLDTAPGYGGSEEWIGRALGDLGLRDLMGVVTKVAPLRPDLPPAEASRRIREGVEGSLARLGVPRVAACLFHREANLAYADELLALREEGLVAKAGVSLVHPEAAARALRIPGLEAWQIASNVLDRRYTDPGLVAAARDAGVSVWVRSVYLQGLLLMDDDATPPFLRGVIPARRELRGLADRLGISLAELAMRAMLGQPGVQAVVVGVESLAQVRENLRLAAKGGLPNDAREALESFQPGLPEFVVSPWEWDRARAAFEVKPP